MLTIIVTGGRKFYDRRAIFKALDDLHARREITLVVDGKCPTGADPIGNAWAVDRGVGFKRCPADWTRFGKAAGAIRNSQMLKLVGPDNVVVVAFPGGPGTADMVKKARRAGVEVIEPLGDLME